MAKDWAYAKMVQEAASAGGPEEWIELTKNKAYISGASDMKKELTPIIISIVPTCLGLGSILPVLFQKIRNGVIEKRNAKRIIEREADIAEINLKRELTDAIEKKETENEEKEI